MFEQFDLLASRSHTCGTKLTGPEPELLRVIYNWRTVSDTRGERVGGFGGSPSDDIDSRVVVVRCQIEHKFVNRRNLLPSSRADTGH